MGTRFVDEAIIPEGQAFDTGSMASGEPGMPSRFRWRERTFDVRAVLRSWRETGKCSHGSPDIYVRKHWFEIVTTDGQRMRIYFDRQPRRGRRQERWWLFTLEEGE